MTTYMKAMGISRYHQEKLETFTIPVPSIADDEVLVEVHAASVNPVDFKIRDGVLKLLVSYRMPIILGFDFAGTVAQVGSKVTKFKVGDKVYGLPRRTMIGTFAEYFAVKAEEISFKPKNLTYVEAASIPLVGLTIYQAFNELMGLQAGEKILIQAGAGGIGTFAIQLARVMDTYIATTASPAGEALVTRLGADLVINYREQNFWEVLHDYDCLLDVFGGKSLDEGFKIMRRGGRIVSLNGTPNARFGKIQGLGFLKTEALRIASLPLTLREKKYDVTYNMIFVRPDSAQLDILRGLYEEGRIVPIVDKVFPLADAQEALDYSQSGRAKGKIVLKVK
ncbi:MULTISPECIES: NADP-dependent oxidoreductase [Gordonibacter]|uniref:NADP-dependent oxidoreductase n=2 Tax=Gordonibacter TaxID=644652 RepID=A0ABT7DIJ6_9ACTN|nr:NADP-dependent oxidoreductase [Gordonibacter sp. KGMB12511]MDJ1649347.1 NADP-dependent oxidoreductase [Gordonibacter sp. KGMB12511]HIW75186.1 NADP-dependent oxidoreductase [Candidatus Gordonibacter avicola]